MKTLWIVTAIIFVLFEGYAVVSNSLPDKQIGVGIEYFAGCLWATILYKEIRKK